MRSIRFMSCAVPIVCLALAAEFANSAESESQAANGKGSRTITFCQGVDGYNQMTDVEIWQLAPTTILRTNPQVTVDENNGGGESQVLMRFDGIFGDQEKQIPPGSTIISARLEVSAFDQGDTVHLHRMMVPFGNAPTWNKMVSGVSADDLEAMRASETFTFGKISAAVTFIPFEVTDTVQAWSSGAENHGWVFMNVGGNGWDFYSSDFDKSAQRPRLVVKFIPPAAR